MTSAEPRRSESPVEPPPVCASRRALLRRAALGGVGLAAAAGLGACATGSPPAAAPATTPESPSGSPSGSPSVTSAATPATTPPASPPASASRSAAALVAAKEVPVGGGVVLSEEKVVVTQPKAGQFQGFDATCTHQGCTVAGVSGGTISCYCHGSAFDAATGAVQTGPATKPLAKVRVRVEDGRVVRA